MTSESHQLNKALAGLSDRARAVRRGDSLAFLDFEASFDVPTPCPTRSSRPALRLLPQPVAQPFPASESPHGQMSPLSSKRTFPAQAR